MLGSRDLTAQESCEMLSRDIRLAHRLGFTVMRTKMPVITDELAPVQNWRKIIRMALPLAEKLGIQMCLEIHTPTNLEAMKQMYGKGIKGAEQIKDFLAQWQE